MCKSKCTHDEPILEQSLQDFGEVMVSSIEFYSHPPFYSTISLPPLVCCSHLGFQFLTFISRLQAVLIDRNFLETKCNVVLDEIRRLKVVSIIAYHSFHTLGSCIHKSVASVVKAVRELNIEK
jgi:hypothetical protein